MYDVCKSVKYKKPGAFQVLLLLPQLITPHSAKKKKWAARCIMTNIHLFREGRWETLLEKPPGLKPLMSFNKHKRALSQVKAGDFSAAARTPTHLTGDSVATETCLEELKRLHPQMLNSPRSPGLVVQCPWTKSPLPKLSNTLREEEESNGCSCWVEG